MSAFVEAVRGDEQVRESLLDLNTNFGNVLAYDRALIAATLREAAKRVREEAEAMDARGGLHPMHAYEWRAAADYLTHLERDL